MTIRQVRPSMDFGCRSASAVGARSACALCEGAMGRSKRTDGPSIPRCRDRPAHAWPRLDRARHLARWHFLRCLVATERLALGDDQQAACAQEYVACGFLGQCTRQRVGLFVRNAPAARAWLYRGQLQLAEIAAVSALTGASVKASALTAAGIGADEIAPHGFERASAWRALALALIAPACCLRGARRPWRF